MGFGTSAQIPTLLSKTLSHSSLVCIKGVAGLKDSRWASEAITQASASRAPPSPMTTRTPFVPISLDQPLRCAYAPHQQIGNFLTSPLPVHARMADPALQTVLVPNPWRPGYLIEVTGFSRNQVPQPMLPIMSPPRIQEHVTYPQQTPPTQPDIYHGQKSNKSSSSGLNYNLSSTPCTSFRGRGATNFSLQNRTALTSVRQGDDVQAKLQSHPNNSLVGRSPNA